MINLLLFGPPGAGKGTQSEKLIEKYDYIHLSTGDIFRTAIAKKTSLGLKAKKYMSKGELVPDDIVIGMVSEEFKLHPGAKGFVFDGFPRTTSQAKALDIMLKNNGTDIKLMIALEVEEGELIDRLKKRAVFSGRTDDQDITIIKNRLDVYRNNTEPLIDYYKDQNKFVDIEGMGSIENIFDRISAVVDKLV